MHTNRKFDIARDGVVNLAPPSTCLPGVLAGGRTRNFLRTPGVGGGGGSHDCYFIPDRGGEGRGEGAGGGGIAMILCRHKQRGHHQSRAGGVGGGGGHH